MAGGFLMTSTERFLAATERFLAATEHYRLTVGKS